MSNFNLKTRLNSLVFPIRRDFKKINGGNELDQIVTDSIKEALYDAIKAVMHSNIDEPEIKDIWETFEGTYDTNAQIGSDEDVFIKEHITTFIARHYDACEKLFRS